MSILEFKAEQLPSRGLTYPENTIFILEKFTWQEVQDLSTMNLSVETKIDRFLKALKVNTELKLEDLCYIDYIYMHLSRVATVYNGNSISFPVMCPYCGVSFKQDMELANLETNDISEFADLIPIPVTIQGTEYEFNYITVNKIIKWFKLMECIGRYEALEEIKKERTKLEPKITAITPDNPDTVTQDKWEKINKQFIELNGLLTNKTRARAVKYKDFGANALLLAFMCSEPDTEKFDTFLRDVKNVSGEEIEYLEFVENTLGEGLKPVMLTCQKEDCSKIFSFSLEENVNNIYPFRRSSRDIADKLRNSKKSKDVTMSDKE